MLISAFLIAMVAVMVGSLPDRLLAQEPLRIPYGVTTSLQHLPVLVGKDSGLFAKHGLNFEPIDIRGGALITTMIMSGTVQFSGAGAESVVSARIEGGDVTLIACPADTDVVYFYPARPEIKNEAQLKGKKQRASPGSVRQPIFICARLYVPWDWIRKKT